MSSPKPARSSGLCFEELIADDETVLPLPAKSAGPVEKWRDWFFWTLDFDSFTTEGKYYLQCVRARSASVVSVS